jgi:hypothetical protein
MNYRDVGLLNNSLDQLGETFLKQRMLEEQKKKGDEELGLRRQQLGIEQGRADAATAHYNKMETAQTDAAAKAQQAADLRDKQQMLQTVMQLNVGGALAPGSLDSVNQWLRDDEHFGKTGMQLIPPKEKAPQAGQNALAQAYQQADMWKTKADQARTTDPEKAAQYDEFSTNLRKWGNLQANAAPKVERNTSITSTDPSDPNKKITQRMSPDELKAYQTQQSLRQQAQEAISKGKNPAAVRARFKELTGQEL